jgi:hypothetical protein
MRVILRADDICALTDPVQLHQVYGPHWERGLPVCLSVIPRSAARFTAHGPEAIAPTDLREAPALCAFLTELARTGLVEIALHGYEHRTGELAASTQAQIAARLAAGLELLRAALPGVAITVLVPPHDALSPAGLRAARQLGLRLCSSWAACHGGTRLAHLWSRIRRRAGLSVATLRGGCWATDCAVLDFGDPGPEAAPAPEGCDFGVSEPKMNATPTSTMTTRRLLARFGASQAPIALPQHYWRLLDAAGKPNARHAQWLQWLAAYVFASPAAVEFVRYGD